LPGGKKNQILAALVAGWKKIYRPGYRKIYFKISQSFFRDPFFSKNKFFCRTAWSNFIIYINEKHFKSKRPQKKLAKN
jgi:hypothetical protein